MRSNIPAASHCGVCVVVIKAACKTKGRSPTGENGLATGGVPTQPGSGLCQDVDWPDKAQTPREAAMMAARPDVDWKALSEDFNQIGAEVVEPQPTDRTASERMRRYRAKKKREAANLPVTDGAATDELPLRLIAGE
jgi:hypothetical protein